MYWEYLGFREPPFSLTPNPEFLYMSAHHQEALAHLLYAVESRAGFIELSGEVGTGKTTIIRTLLGQLSPATFRTALIFNPELSPLGLLKEINREFDLDSDSNETRELHLALNEFLLRENLSGRTVVLVIDEAQNLSTQVLEQVRLISNLETEREKLIQIVLVGQPELRQLLSRQELRQLSQRITVRYHLKPMAQGEVNAYIRHRIRTAGGGREPVVFTHGAVKRISRYSGGLPRLINGVCDRSLLLAYTREVTEISPDMVALAIRDILKEEPVKAHTSLYVAMFLIAVLGIVVAGQLYFADSRGAPVKEMAPRVVPSVNGTRHLQELLSATGHFQGVPDGVFDQKTEASVRSFQEAEHLKVDGKPGGRTLARLYQRTGGAFSSVPAVTGNNSGVTR